MIVLFNKPYGVICQFSGGHITLKSYIPMKRVYPAGRLDADSEGLVVLTDDGALQHRISDPAHKLTKTYLVQVEGTITPSVLAKLSGGIRLGESITLPAPARLIAPPDWLWPRDPPIRVRNSIPTSWIELALREGKNRQVRRMTAAVGFPTLRLVRTRIGPWKLNGLAPGEWREVH